MGNLKISKAPSIGTATPTCLRFCLSLLDIRRQIDRSLLGPFREKPDRTDFRLLRVSSRMHEEYLEEFLRQHWFIVNMSDIGSEGIGLGGNESTPSEPLELPYYARVQKWRISLWCGQKGASVRMLRLHFEMFVLLLSQNEQLRHLKIDCRYNRGPKSRETSDVARRIYEKEKQHSTYYQHHRCFYSWIPESGHLSCGRHIYLRCLTNSWTLGDSSATIVRSELCDAQCILMPFGKL